MLYVDQGKLAEAEQMYERALKGYEKLSDPSTRGDQQLKPPLRGLGKLAEA
jgi:hypothetical protein